MSDEGRTFPAFAGQLATESVSRSQVKEEGCYAFVDGGIFAGWEGNCRIYRFEFERYAGDERVDKQHPRNCHNMR